MAHELTADDQMVSGMNKTPWHGLGTVMPGRLTAAEALNLANLNWTVTTEPIFDGDMVEIGTHRATRRSDTNAVLGVVTKNWTPVQNTFLVEVAEALAQASADFTPVIETAGSLRGGRLVWALVHLGQRQLAGSDHKTYLLLTNSHDGSRAVRGTLTDVRVVCANTWRMAETNGSQLYVQHTKHVEARIREAVNLLGWASDATRATFALFEAMAVAPLAADTVAGIYREALTELHEPDGKRIDEAVEEAMALFRAGRGNEGKTAFDALNGMTDWIDHARAFRGDDAVAVAERRMEFATMGVGAKVKAQTARLVAKAAGVKWTLGNGGNRGARPADVAGGAL